VQGGGGMKTAARGVVVSGTVTTGTNANNPQTELVYVTDLTRPDRLLLDKNGPTLSFVRNPHLMLWIESQPKVFIFELDLNTLPKTWFQRSQFLGFEKRCGEVSKNNFHAKLKIYVLGSEFIPGGDALKLIILKLVV
jgi:hypothetical protein